MKCVRLLKFIIVSLSISSFLVHHGAAFPEMQSTSSCLGASLPQTSERSTITLKMVRRFWISHGLVASIAEALLVEVLAYNVVLVILVENMFVWEVTYEPTHSD